MWRESQVGVVVKTPKGIWSPFYEIGSLSKGGVLLCFSRFTCLFYCKVCCAFRWSGVQPELSPRAVPSRRRLPSVGLPAAFPGSQGTRKSLASLPRSYDILLAFCLFQGWVERTRYQRLCHGSSSVAEIMAWVKLSHHSQNYIPACKDTANNMLPHLPYTRKINSRNPKLNRNKMQALCTQWIIYKKIILWGLLLHSA